MDTIAMISVMAGIISAIIIAIDLISHPQRMGIMNVVWPLTALWASVLALAAYFYFGRAKRKAKLMPSEMQMPIMAKAMSGPHKPMQMEMSKEITAQGMLITKRPQWQSVTLSTLHCGAGCTLADLIGEWFLYFIPFAIGGSLFAGSMILDYVLALAIGVYFQYRAMRSMNGGISGPSVWAKAFRADFLSLTSWQIGMYGFMALSIFVFFAPAELVRSSWTFWFMMQISMLFGFLFAFPTNIFLIRAGIKKAM